MYFRFGLLSLQVFFYIFITFSFLHITLLSSLFNTSTTISNTSLPFTARSGFTFFVRHFFETLFLLGLLFGLSEAYNYFQSMKQCFLVHEAVKVYLFIYRRVFAYLLREKQ